MTDKEYQRMVEERAEKYRSMFYKYSYIEEGTPIKREDIIKHWNNGFMKIRSVENCGETELMEALLGADWKKIYFNR